jgi:Glycosyl transferase family 11
MSVEVVFSGRLGNNLFQYVLGRIIAEHLGLELNCTTLYQGDLSVGNRALDVGPQASFQELNHHFPNAMLHLPGDSVDSPVESYDINEDRDWTGQIINLAGIIGNSRRRRILLSGYFQRFEYFAPYRQDIRRWLQLAPQPLVCKVSPTDVAINIRRGFDFWVLNWTLPMAYYHSALARLHEVGKVYVCGTGIDDQVRASLDRYNPVYYDASPIEHFAFLQCFKRIIISNSTFAWWAAFLSDAVEIIGPRYSVGEPLAFTGCCDIDLTMEKERYHEIDIEGRASLAFAPSARLAGLRTSGDGSTIIDYHDGTSCTISLKCHIVEWLANKLQTHTPVLLADIRRLCLPDELGALMADLVAHDVFCEAPLYLDLPRNEDASPERKLFSPQMVVN